MPDRPVRAGVPRMSGGLSTARIAVAASLAWVIVAGLWLWLASGGEALMRVMVLVLPVAAIWLVVYTARNAAASREEVRRLEATVDAVIMALQQANEPEPPARTSPVSGRGEPPVAPTPVVAPPRPAPAAVIRPIEEQPSLALGPVLEAEEPPPLGAADLVRALNFPENDQDHEGFAALRRALKDRKLRQLIQAAQDVLTLLSQDGIYTDDLRPDRARPDIWRRFAQGERGRAVAQLGGIRDRSCLALTMTRMREDTIFRDTAHHFLRLFDRMLTAFEPGATDEEIAALSETRTARAFMLVGRVTGAFD